MSQIDILPMELLELILLKVFGIRFCRSSSLISEKEKIIIKCLSSISRNWFNTILRRRFKKAENRIVSSIFQTIFKTRIIIRSNQRFLQDIIEPDILIEPLISSDCLTMKQATLIRKLLNRGAKNYELLSVIRSLPLEKQQDFLDCLRSFHQQRVADVIEKGGVFVRCRVAITSGRTKASKENEEQLVKGLQKMLQQFDKRRLKQLYTDIGMGGIELFEASFDRCIVIWLLCPSTQDLSHLKDISLTSGLLKAMQSLFKLTWSLYFEGFDGNITSSGIKPTEVFIGNIEFKKQVVVRSISARRQKSLSTIGQTLFDVTSLQDKIYLRFFKTLCVYEDVPPFARVKDVDMPSVMFKPNFTKACDKNLCLYTTSDSGVCKLSAMDYSLKIWLPDIGLKMPCPLSVCCDGRLLILRNDISSPCIELYGDDAQLRQSVILPTTLHWRTSLSYYCAIESDKGDFILSYKGSEGFSNEYNIALVTSVGSSSLVVTPQPKEAWSQPHFANLPCVTPFKRNLFIVYDSNSGTVVTLNQEFKVKHVLLSKNKGQIHRPRKIHYKEIRKQLIVIDSDNGKDIVSIFSLVDDSEGEQTILVSPEHATTLDIRNLTPTDVTSLRHDILLLLNGQLIAVYEDNNQFSHKFDVGLREIISPTISTSFMRILANNKGDVYVTSSDAAFRLIGHARVFIQSGDPIGISSPYSISMSIDGNILMPQMYPASFEIRKPGSTISVNLPSYMDEIAQVVEISSGLFVVVYRKSEPWDCGNIMKLSTDGEFELRPKPDDKSDKLETVWSLAWYSSDRIIATDDVGNRVILLDSELNTQYTLLNCRNPFFMCYKKDKLIVVHSLPSEVDVYTLADDKQFNCTIY